MAKVKGYFKRGGTIFVRNWLITDEEKKEVADLKACGYDVKLAKESKKVVEEKHTITADFNIPYDKVKKEDMLEYVQNFVKDEEKIEKWAKASHKEKNGKKSFSQISSKKAFFEIFFPEKWEKEILPMLEERIFKKSKKKKEEDFFAKYLK